MAKTKSGLVAAKLVNLSTNEEVHFMFNPSEYTLSKSNSWERKTKKGKNTPSISYKQGQPITLKLQLIFDTFMDEPRRDVREYTDGLWKMMVVDETKKNPNTDKSQPPFVALRWGGKFNFEAIIKSLSQKFTLFLDDGTPVRSTVDITLEQLKDPTDFRPQAAIAQPTDTRKSLKATLGQRLDHIAADSGGSPSDYRKIAEANNIDNPHKVKPGKSLSF